MVGKTKRKARKYTGQGLKDFRGKVAILKKKGLVSKRVDARSQKATSYMVKKVNALEQVILGNATAVKTPKKIREEYGEMFPTRGQFIIVPHTEPNQKIRLKKVGGHLTLFRDSLPYEKTVGAMTPSPRKIRTSRWTEVILPFEPHTMLSLAEGLAQHPRMEALLASDELWAYRIYGHNSAHGFPNLNETADGLVPTLRDRYASLFKVADKWDRDRVNHFSLIKYWPANSVVPQGPIEDKLYNDNVPLRNKRMKNGLPTHRAPTQWELDRQADPARKKRERRENETPEERARRLKANAERMARKRAQQKR